MSSTSPNNGLKALPENKELDLWELFQNIWAGRWIILLTTLVFVAVTISQLHSASYRYTAKLVLSPAQGGGSSKINGLSGLASIAGINLPQSEGALSFSLYKQGVHSASLADILAENQRLMHRIFASEWNKELGKWQQPTTRLAPVKSVIRNIIGIPASQWSPPDGGRMEEFLRNEVQVSDDAKSPFLTITFQHTDPEFAKYFLDTLNVELDKMLRKQALERSNDNIAYLTNQLSQVAITEHRLAIAQTLIDQENQRMAANSMAPYAANPVGAASASLRPTSPNPPKMLLLSILGGVVTGTVLVIVITNVRKRRALYLLKQQSNTE